MRIYSLGISWMKEETLIKIRAYLQSIKPMFIDWSIRLVSEDWIIKITYRDNFIDFTVKEKVKGEDKYAYNRVRIFCFNAYYDYEWDGKEMNSEQIGKLLWLDGNAVRQQLKRTFKKLKKYGKPLLQER